MGIRVKMGCFDQVIEIHWVISASSIPPMPRFNNEDIKMGCFDQVIEIHWVIFANKKHPPIPIA